MVIVLTFNKGIILNFYLRYILLITILYIGIDLISLAWYKLFVFFISDSLVQRSETSEIRQQYQNYF